MGDSQQDVSTTLNHPGLVANAALLPLLGVIRSKASTSNNCFPKNFYLIDDRGADAPCFSVLSLLEYGDSLISATLSKSGK